MKTCTKCRRSLPEENFYRDTRTTNKLVAACKECAAKKEKERAQTPQFKSRRQRYILKYRKLNAEKIKATQAKYNREHQTDLYKARRLYIERNKDRVLISTRAWKAKNKEKCKTYLNAYRKRNPEKYAAKLAVMHAKKRGVLTQKPCEICGSLKVEAHHTDYSKPLEVIWLCRQHHEDAHHKNLQLT